MIPPADAGQPKAAKDIPEMPVLEWLVRVPRPATWFDGFDNSVQEAMPAGTPAKVALAKMRALIRRGFVSGCGCGCRGDFEITRAGLAFIAESRASRAPSTGGTTE